MRAASKGLVHAWTTSTKPILDFVLRGVPTWSSTVGKRLAPYSMSLSFSFSPSLAPYPSVSLDREINSPCTYLGTACFKSGRQSTGLVCFSRRYCRIRYFLLRETDRA
ncbi:hypothetical protein M0657_003598 [Pyricularia oryzae]|uniref:Uncharacterized protein n=1 Tax=Pyricularia oryzae TaxID=318829 RepID=A0A4P7NGB1_PYROR|nr:hypothetical protein M0657_003598 [Pyricularia oryzae]KAI7928795.1 hypothetical protein M9X92_001589 [Pyricularia oryzae]QBZ60906.1 hypothetical protein PoMZ_07850 [Pyricularia oryzae]